MLIIKEGPHHEYVNQMYETERSSLEYRMGNTIVRH